jgi:hypothetical protein
MLCVGQAMRPQPQINLGPDDSLEYKALESKDLHTIKRWIGEAAVHGWALVSHQALPAKRPNEGMYFAAVLSRPRGTVERYDALPKRR